MQSVSMDTGVKQLNACIYLVIIYNNKNSSADEIASVNFYAVRPEAIRIRWNNAKITAIMPAKVIQGYRFWYQSKAHIRFPISD